MFFAKNDKKGIDDYMRRAKENSKSKPIAIPIDNSIIWCLFESSDGKERWYRRAVYHDGMFLDSVSGEVLTDKVIKFAYAQNADSCFGYTSCFISWFNYYIEEMEAE